MVKKISGKKPSFVYPSDDGHKESIHSICLNDIDSSAENNIHLKQTVLTTKIRELKKSCSIVW